MAVPATLPRALPPPCRVLAPPHPSSLLQSLLTDYPVELALARNALGEFFTTSAGSATLPICLPLSAGDNIDPDGYYYPRDGTVAYQVSGGSAGGKGKACPVFDCPHAPRPPAAGRPAPVLLELEHRERPRLRHYERPDQ
jgi:hypothetical protein